MPALDLWTAEVAAWLDSKEALRRLQEEPLTLGFLALEIALERGDPEAAAAIQEAYPGEDFGCSDRIGDLFAQRGDEARAVEHYLAYLVDHLHDEHVVGRLRALAPERALEAYASLPPPHRNTSSNEVRSYRNQASLLRAVGRLDHAAETERLVGAGSWKGTCSLPPPSVDGPRGGGVRASALEADGRFEEALAELREYRSEYPHRWGAHRELYGDCLLALGREEEALEEWLGATRSGNQACAPKAYSLAPLRTIDAFRTWAEECGGWLLFGDFLWRHGHRVDAELAWERAREGDPGDWDVFERLARLATGNPPLGRETDEWTPATMLAEFFD
jgi:tetratricopeptide (TPR) repeat protein